MSLPRHHRHRCLGWLASAALLLFAVDGTAAPRHSRSAAGDVYVYGSAGYYKAGVGADRQPSLGIRFEGEDRPALTGGVSVGLARRFLVGLSGTVHSIAADSGSAAADVGTRFGIHALEGTLEGVLFDTDRLLVAAFGGGGVAVVDDRRHLQGFLARSGTSKAWSQVAGLRGILRGIRTVPFADLAAFVDVRYRWAPVAHLPGRADMPRESFAAGGLFASAGLVYWWDALL